MQPPELYSLDAERALLGCLLIDPDALPEIADFVAAEHFHLEAHRAVYRTVRALDAGGVTVDNVTAGEALARSNVAAPAGGWEAFLIGLLNAVPTSVNVSGYARIVADHARRRGLVQAAGRIASLAYDLETPGDVAVGRATEEILALQREHDGRQVLSPAAYVRDFLDDLEGDAETETIRTPFVALNELLLGGLARPFVHILAARPKVGKSALALQIAGYAAVTLGRRVYLATTEMSARQFARRVVAQQSAIPAGKLRQRSLTPQEWEAAYRVAGRLSEAGPYLDVSAGLTPGQVRARAMRLAARGGLDLMIVDHLHEMVADEPNRQRHLELGAMARSLRDTAKQLGVPLLLVAQLSRSVESRQDKRPQLADLREAGALEEVAYSVMFLYRESYYNEMLKAGASDPTELIVAAHRDGPTGTVTLYWDGPLMRYTEQPGLEQAPAFERSNGHAR